MKNSSVPVVRQISWLAMVPQFIAISATIGLAYLLGAPDSFICGGLAYLIYSNGSRRLIPKAHRAGIRLMKAQHFAEAIPRFKESFDFFERHAWVDRYRSVTLMSPSAMSYREMALCNSAFCYGQLGDGEKCLNYYQKCLDLFPDSSLASASLRMLDSVSTPVRS